MDCQKFIQQLPELYNNWGQDSLHPRSDRFQKLSEQVPEISPTNQIQSQMSKENVMQVLNLAVACLEEEEVYCQVGCFQGASLIAALLNNSQPIAYAVDDFAGLDSPLEKLTKFADNISQFGLEEQVIFCDQDFEDFFIELQQAAPEIKIGVYCYQGSSDYRSQLLSLLLAKPFFPEKALIVVNHSGDSVQQAILDFIATTPECQLLLEAGIYLLSWDRNQQDVDTNILKQKRNNFLIQSLKGVTEEAVLWEKIDLKWPLRSGVIAKIDCPVEWVIYNDIFVDGEYDIPINKALELASKEKFNFLDIGANVGFFTLRLADIILRNQIPLTYLQGTLIEGSPSVYRQLTSRISEMPACLDDKIEVELKLVHGLVGNRQGNGQIFEGSFHGMNSIFPVGQFIGTDVPYIDLTSLYSENPNIDLLKCDIEGSELLFLENYKDLLTGVRCAVFEFHHNYYDPKQCFDILAEVGLINRQLLRDESTYSVHFFWK
ncbi:FkbM family methyltransferase [Kamptonema sp. UHCC 0994]|uniref:FkbM family methyltransferase n=1 Tax=Kamptonema sp. UHCC 0994 TaxID=3031329 RepID=UPI0023BA3651|nr:FkbM family methyltransferase [Kamptonema sp. UHCC 0994]MDF0554320.1 FkbM family methyltransferase [Kamptonema sp. UHCC 0994]